MRRAATPFGLAAVLLAAAAVLLAAAAVLVGGAASASAAQPQDVQDRRPGYSWVSTYAGWTVWSERVDGSHLLFARHSGTTRLLAAPPSRVTHDPGAGRGPDGRPAAVYQRCSGASCEIWAVDLATGRQRKVRGLGEIRRETKAASDDDFTGWETHPRIWGNRVAFKTGGSAKSLPRLRVGPSTTGGGAVKTLRVDPQDDGGDMKQLALGPRQIVAYWEDDFCFGRCAGLYIHGLVSGRQQLLDDAAGTGDCIATIEDVRFDGKAFRWTRELTAIESGATNCPPKINRLRYDPRSGRRTAS